MNVYAVTSAQIKNNCLPYSTKNNSPSMGNCLDSLIFDISQLKPLDHPFTNIDELKDYLKAKYEDSTGEKWTPWYKGVKAKLNMKVKARKTMIANQPTLKVCKDKDDEMTDGESMETAN